MNNTYVHKNILKSYLAIFACMLMVLPCYASAQSSSINVNISGDEISKIPLETRNKNSKTELGSVSYPSDLSNPSNSADYLIITSDYFYYPAKQDHDAGTFNNKLNELAHWRASYNGFDVAVVNVNDSFIGGNNDSKIRTFTRNVYHNWSAPHMSDDHVRYLLLVGDTPFVVSHLFVPPNINNGVSDQWYGCIGSEDYSDPKILVGRFPVDNYNELDIIACKTIEYERNPAPGDWHKKMLMAQVFPIYDYPFVKETLLENSGYDVLEVYSSDSDSDVSDAINNGVCMIHYWGHGSRDGWYGSLSFMFQINDILNLHNGNKLPVIISDACYTGSFQGDFNCMGEVFLNTPDKGAVAFYGASRPAGLNYYSYYILKAMFENFSYVIGEQINYMIVQTHDIIDWEVYNLLGDPALDLSGSIGHREKPDLAISHLDITTNSVHSIGDEELGINTTVTIHNIGGSAAENIPVRFITYIHNDSQQIINEQTIPIIISGGTSVLTQQWTISKEEKISLIVQIDPNDTIDEAFKLNNQAGITFTPVAADAGGPYTGFVNQNIYFSGSATDGVKPYSSWFWDFGDGSHSYSQDPYHTYIQTGNYTVTFTVTDACGTIATNTTTATVTVEQLRADAGRPYAGIVGQSIHFAGTATGGIQPYTYRWDFGDNTPAETQQNPDHWYQQTGIYTVTLSVTDTLGTIANDTTAATLLDFLPPVYNINKDAYYFSIQAAIDDANPRDTIHVNNGTYYENIYILQPLTLIGENKETTIIDGDCAYPIPTVGLYACNDIVLHQFTIKNGNPGIMIFDANHTTISDCIITDATDFGIYILKTNNVIVSRSSVTDIGGAGYGIWFFESPNNTIFQNLITRCDYSIYLSESSSQNNIYENTIKDNRITGIKIQSSTAPTNNNRLYHNNFINNAQNAYDECNDIWYNPDLKEGNFWDDYTGSDAKDDGIGDSPYNISGGSNQDLYPLMKPWIPIPGDLDHDGDIDQDDFALFLQTYGHSIGDPEFNSEADYNNNGVVDLVDYQIWLMYYRDFVVSHTDILISGLSANYTSNASTSFSAVHSTPITIKLTATVKNNGTIDITTPFQVSFYGYRGPYDPSTRPIHLGTVEISSLFVGETTEATIMWRLQPEMQTILVIVDSVSLIEESDETNNQATISLPHHILWKSLTETTEIYKKLGDQYKVPTAKKVVQIASDGLTKGVYTDPVVFMRTLKTVAKLEVDVGRELKGQVQPALLQKYQDIVKQLITEIDGIMNNQHSSDIPWDDANKIAAIQMQICDIVLQMLH
ncbi:MAG: C25 family cysteine peptidase [Euryarchaeota archaeon]|nr:C25 family cysteine peptidase [Euryarchaeota archaeon]